MERIERDFGADDIEPITVLVPRWVRHKIDQLSDRRDAKEFAGLLLTNAVLSRVAIATEGLDYDDASGRD